MMQLVRWAGFGREIHLQHIYENNCQQIKTPNDYCTLLYPAWKDIHILACILYI